MSYAHIATAIVLFAAGIGAVSAQSFGPWSDPQRVDAIDTDAAEGCPIEAPGGLSLYFASNRAATGAQGKQDVWRVHRATVQSPWDAAENLGPPVNTPEFDYCPTPLAGGALLFVSSQQTTDDCYPGDTPPPPPTGGPSAGDIFATREDPVHVWSTPVDLGCYPQGPNTPGAEFSPSQVQTAEGTFLFFSSNGYPDSQGQDIYMSQMLDDGTVTAGVRVAELSTSADDRMPNVRADGLEIVFSSNRSGGTAFDQDIYVATRADTRSSWSAPQRIDTPAINTTASETRASLSEDGTRLYFGRKANVDDPGDVFVATRERAAPTGAAYPAPTLGAPMLALLAALVAGVAWFARGISREARRRYRKGDANTGGNTMRHIVYGIGFAVLSLAATRSHAVDHVVQVGSNSIAFEPQVVTINVGDTVTFRSQTAVHHNVHANDDSFRCAAGCDGQGGDGAPQAGPWESTIRFDHAGYVGYRCDPHAAFGMTGAVHIVEGGAGGGDPAHVPITAGFTGAWYDPTQSGHGIFIEVLPGNQMLAWWFTFNPDGTQQAWFGNVGAIDGDTATVDALQAQGGRWIPNFDPGNVSQPAWGTLTFQFTDCNHGRVDFTSSVAGYGQGHMDLTRITQPEGLSCP